MEYTLYQHFNQGAVLEAINQLASGVSWLNLDHSLFVSNQICLNLSGFMKQDKAEGKSYIDMPCSVSECYQEFIAQDKKAEQGAAAEFLGLYCYHNGEWKVTHCTKSLIKNSDGQPVGVCANIVEIKSSYMTRFLTQLMQLESHFKSRKGQAQLCYQLTDTASSDTFSLTERQSECLFYLLRGFTVPMIAERLFVSRRTVESHIENIKLKVGCFTKSELVEKALHEGWIGTMPKSLLKVGYGK